MSDSDFLADFKIIERKVPDSEPISIDSSYNSNGFPEITHRSHSKIKLGRSLHIPSRYVNKSDHYSNRINGYFHTLDQIGHSDGGEKRVIPFKMPLVEAKKMEWTNPVEDEGKTYKMSMLHQIRYNFSGKIIRNSSEYKSYTGLYNHGDEPDRAGYTISELIWLCQSAMSSQVNISLYTLSNIIENPPINQILSESKVTHYRWYSYIHNDVGLVNILVNLTQRNLNSANTKLLLKLLSLIFYGRDADDSISALELFRSLYPEYGVGIYHNSFDSDVNISNNQEMVGHLINDSNLLGFISTLIKDGASSLECIQILTGLIGCRSFVIKSFLNHNVFSDVINMYKAMLSSCPVRSQIVKLFRILYIYSSKDAEQTEYLNDLFSDDGIDLLDSTNFSLDDTCELKWILEYLSLIRTILNVESIESDIISQLFIELNNYNAIGHNKKLILECISEIYLLAVDLLVNGNFLPFFQILSGKVIEILDQLDLKYEGHFKLLNSLVLFVKFTNGSIDVERVSSSVYAFLDKYCEINSDYFFNNIDGIFNSICFSEPRITNFGLINLLYGVNILCLINKIDLHHLIFSKITSSIEDLIRKRTRYDYGWNVVEKNEYQYNLARTLPLFHCFSKFLNIPLSQFTTISTNGEDLCNTNQLMQSISLQTIFTLQPQDVHKLLNLLIDKWALYKPYLTGEFFVTEFIAIYFKVQNNSQLVQLLDDVEISLKLAKIAQIYLFNICNPRFESDALLFDSIGPNAGLNLAVDIERLLEICKTGLVVSHSSTISILISLCHIMDTSTVESVWKDNEIMIQLSKSIKFIKSNHDKMYISLADDTVILGSVEDYARKDLIYLYSECLDKEFLQVKSSSLNAFNEEKKAPNEASNEERNVEGNEKEAINISGEGGVIDFRSVVSYVALDKYGRGTR